MLYVIVMEFPGAMDHLAVFINLFGGQRGSTFAEAMRRHRHDVCRAIGKPDAGAGKRDLHHVFSKVTSRMHHVLVRRGDAATRGVVVSAKVRSDTTTARGRQQQRQD